MTYELYIGDRTFSSWSLRGWLMCARFGLEFNTHDISLFEGTMARDMAALAPARLVPTLKLPDGTVVGESLAIAETLAERHPEIAFWPADAAARATARMLCAEMAASFSALRTQCPMQLQHIVVGFQASQATIADLSRIEDLWAHARRFASDGPWLFGSYSLADAMFAPVCARIIGYDLPVSDSARAYCDTAISDPAFLEWRAEGLKTTYDPFPYTWDNAPRDWPAHDRAP